MAIIQVNLCWMTYPVENCRIFVGAKFYPNALVEGNLYVKIREKMLEFWSNDSTYTVSI